MQKLAAKVAWLYRQWGTVTEVDRAPLMNGEERVVSVAAYDLQGRRVEKMNGGIYIIRIQYADGTTEQRKVRIE